MTTFHSLDAYWPGLQVIYLTLLYNRQERECVVTQCTAKKIYSAIVGLCKWVCAGHYAALGGSKKFFFSTAPALLVTGNLGFY